MPASPLPDPADDRDDDAAPAPNEGISADDPAEGADDESAPLDGSPAG